MAYDRRDGVIKEVGRDAAERVTIIYALAVSSHSSLNIHTERPEQSRKPRPNLQQGLLASPVAGLLHLARIGFLHKLHPRIDRNIPFGVIF